MAVWKKTGLPVRDESQICMGRDYYAVSGRCRKDQGCEVYSDALNIELAEAIPKFLKGIKYRKETMCVQLGLFWSKDENVENMMNDVIAWIQETDL